MSLAIQENIVLAPFTTIHVGGKARYFAEVTQPEEMIEAIQFALEKDMPYYIFGGGSNIIFSDEGYKGLVIRNMVKDIDFEEGKLAVGAGCMINEKRSSYLNYKSRCQQIERLHFPMGHPYMLK